MSKNAAILKAWREDLEFNMLGQFSPRRIVAMSDLTYIRTDIYRFMSPPGKPLVWMKGPIQTPPFSAEARIEAGMLSRRLQQGENLGLPHSRPMPGMGLRCRELRIRDKNKNWRIFYHLASDAVVILDVHHKTTQETPKAVLENCRRRLNSYLFVP
jgi:phage-related protein